MSIWLPFDVSADQCESGSWSEFTLFPEIGLSESFLGDRVHLEPVYWSLVIGKPTLRTIRACD